MNSIKKLLPILLIVLYVASAYKLVTDKSGKRTEYNTHIKSAQEYFDQGIVVDAAAELDQAIEMQPSIELYLKKGEYWDAANVGNMALSTADDMLELYPKEPKAYDYALTVYEKYKNFETCYDILDTALKRKVHSDTITEFTEKLKYKYYVEGKSFEEIGAANAGLYSVSRKGLWGYCNRKGIVQLTYAFKYAGAFVGDVAPVIDTEDQVYYINKEGLKKLNIPLELKCEKAGVLLENMAVLYCNGKAGYYDAEFKHLFGEYDYASTMFNGVAAIRNGETWSLINQKGKPLGRETYSDIKYNSVEIISMAKRIFAKSGEKYVLLNTDGKRIGNDSYEDAICFNDETYAAVKINGKWGFVDVDGKIIIEPSYEEAKSFSNGIAAVKKDGAWGYIDTGNQMVIEPVFLDAQDLNSAGCAFVKEKDSFEGKYSILKLYTYNH